jgi:nicotinate phosphoribosyltransferase
MTGGKRLRPLPTLAQARDRARAQLARLPGPLTRLDAAPAAYPVAIAASLHALAAEVDAATADVR